ncbi:hypothetical protein PO124_33730 [Bacillus licheniformis]|nr:hypothetical protein [Bacillus licheniformis]
MKEEDQPEQHTDDKEADTEDHPDGENLQMKISLNLIKKWKRKESNSPNTKTLRNITIMTKTVSRRRKERQKRFRFKSREL